MPRVMAANVEKSPLIRFVHELDFKQIPVSVKRKKKEECPSGLILYLIQTVN